MKIQVASYKKAQHFKKDYVRKNGEFMRFQKCSGNHSFAVVELAEGETFDARGSIYREGITKWNAAGTQSWAKFENRGGTLVALNFDGKEIASPNWVRVLEGNAEIGEEVQAVTA